MVITGSQATPLYTHLYVLTCFWPRSHAYDHVHRLPTIFTYSYWCVHVDVILAWE